MTFPSGDSVRRMVEAQRAAAAAKRASGYGFALCCTYTTTGRPATRVRVVKAK